MNVRVIDHLLAIVFAVVLGATSMLTSAYVFIANVALLAGEGWIMGGTSNPLPAQDYINQVLRLYLQPQPPWFDGQPTFPGYTFSGLTTPEEFWPESGDLTFGDSVSQGVDILNGQIAPALADGNNVAVFGYSQSATIATQEMNNLIDNPPGELSNLHVVLIGDPNNPIGGILYRFQFPDGIKAFSLEPAPQHVPFLNAPLSIGSTPTAVFPTDIYTAEYDGWANFPQDPTNLLALINAIIGVETVHGGYPTFDNLGDVINLGSIGDTNFYMIPQQLPILSGMTGPAEQFFHDALAPGLKLSIDWAYGNPGDPGAGIPIDGIDPIGAAGPWPVTATGHLADISGVIGWLPRMDPLQMLAGMQYAGVQSFVGPINEILRAAGQPELSQSFVNSLLSGYDFTNQVDAFLLNGWNELATELNVADLLGPDAVFNGAPLISGQPLLDLFGVGFDIFNFFGA